MAAESKADGLFSAIGPVLLHSDGGDWRKVETEAELASGEAVAIVIGDNVLSACKRAREELIKLQGEIAEKGKVLKVVYISKDGSEDAMREAVSGTAWLAVPFADIDAAEERVRAFCGLGIVATLPEVVVVDAKTSIVLSTDGAAALARGAFKAETYPGWRTNCLSVAPSGAVAGHAALVTSDALLYMGAYPGDYATLRFKTNRVSVMLNPAPRGDEEDPTATPEPHQLVLSGLTLQQLGAPLGATVVIETHYELPEATSVVVSLRRPEPSAPDAAALASAANAYFGLGASKAKAEALVAAIAGADADGGDPAPAFKASWLASYVADSDCKRISVAVGDVLAIAVEGMGRAPEGGDEKDRLAASLANGRAFQVVETAPRGTVVVGSGTVVTYR